MAARNAILSLPRGVVGDRVVVRDGDLRGKEGVVVVVVVVAVVAMAVVAMAVVVAVVGEEVALPLALAAEFLGDDLLVGVVSD